MTQATLDLTLRRRSPVSFFCADIPGLDAWLQWHDYRPVPIRTSTEWARLKRGGSLIVLYHSGSVLLQGADVDSALELLAPLVLEQHAV